MKNFEEAGENRRRPSEIADNSLSILNKFLWGDTQKKLQNPFRRIDKPDEWVMWQVDGRGRRLCWHFMAYCDEPNCWWLTSSWQGCCRVSHLWFYRVSFGFPLFYWVLLSFTEFYWVLLSFTEFYWVLLSFTEFYWVLLCYTMLYYVILCYTMLYYVILGITGFYRVLPGFTGFYRVLPGII